MIEDKISILCKVASMLKWLNENAEDVNIRAVYSAELHKAAVEAAGVSARFGIAVQDIVQEILDVPTENA